MYVVSPVSPGVTTPAGPLLWNMFFGSPVAIPVQQAYPDWRQAAPCSPRAAATPRAPSTPRTPRTCSYGMELAASWAREEGLASAPPEVAHRRPALRLEHARPWSRLC
jgi:hypothetical protein